MLPLRVARAVAALLFCDALWLLPRAAAVKLTLAMLPGLLLLTRFDRWTGPPPSGDPVSEALAPPAR